MRVDYSLRSGLEAVNFWLKPVSLCAWLTIARWIMLPLLWFEWFRICERLWTLLVKTFGPLSLCSVEFPLFILLSMVLPWLNCWKSGSNSDGLPLGFLSLSCLILRSGEQLNLVFRVFFVPLRLLAEAAAWLTYFAFDSLAIPGLLCWKLSWCSL